MKSILKIFGTVFIIICGFGCAFQTKLIFPSEKLPKDYVFSQFKEGKEIQFKTDDGVNLSGIQFSNFKSEKVILYFHGNASSIDSWRYEYSDLEFLKTDIIFFDYRGYGKSEGKVSEKGLYLDAKALYEYAHKSGYQDSNIFIYGRSIGTGIAMEVAQNKKLAGVILESPYSSLRKMIYHEFWFMMPYFYLSYTLNSCEKARNTSTKVLIIHGMEDDVIPFIYGKELFNCFDGEKTFIAIPGGMHNDLNRFPEKRESLQKFFGAGSYAKNW